MLAAAAIAFVAHRALAPMGETDLHRKAMIRHIELLEHHFAGQQVYVSGDLLVYYEQGNPKKFVVPDAFIVKTNVALMQQGRVLDVDATLSLIAAKASIDHRLPLADSLVYATALRVDAVVWTQDEDFDGLPGVQYFPKRRGA